MRSAEFDRQTVLRAAMNAFTQKGFNKTSMQDLKVATGLHPGSIYCAFENKKGLMLAAIEQYNIDASNDFDMFFAEQSSALKGIKAYLENVVDQCLSCDPEKDCLLLKSINELAQQDEDIKSLVKSQLIRWQGGFAKVIKQGQDAGEIIVNRSAECIARTLVMNIYGLRTYGQTEPEEADLNALAQQIVEDITKK